jgi:hypothetical protein
MKFLSHFINSHLKNYHLFELFSFAIKLRSEYGKSFFLLLIDLPKINQVSFYYHFDYQVRQIISFFAQFNFN